MKTEQEDRARLYEAAQTMATLANSGGSVQELLQALNEVRSATQRLMQHVIMTPKQKEPPTR